MEIRPVLKLRCSICQYEMPDDATMQAYELHFNVEHDTDDIVLDLSVICTCNTSMEFLRSRETKTGFAERYQCPHDGNRTTVRRGRGDNHG